MAQSKVASSITSQTGSSPSGIGWFQHLTLRQGLAANFATGITQDKDGFIWISTVNGLTRFDGRNCRNFTRQAGEPHSLSHRVVRSVFTTQNGTLWVGTQQGLNRYEPDTQTFRRYSFTPFGSDCNFIRTITESADGILWCGTKGGVVRFDPTTAKARLLPIPTDLSAQAGARSIRALLPDGDRLWIGTQAGLYAYNRRTNQFVSYRHEDLVTSSLPDDYIGALTRNQQTGELVVGTNNGFVALLDRSTGMFRRLPLQTTNQAVAALLYTKKGDLWVGLATGGLHRYEPVTNTFATYLNEELNPRSLSCNCVKGLFEDRNGIIWIVTDERGVNWINPTVEKFHQVFDEVTYRPGSSFGLDVCKLSVDRKNKLWAATRDGLLYIDPVTQTHQLYRHNPKNPNSLATDFLHSALADRNGRVWAGGNGLTRFDPASGQFVRVPCSALPESTPGKAWPGVSGDMVFSIIENRNGLVFFGTNEKLTVYNPQTDSYLNQFTDERIRKLPGKNYNTMHVDRKGNLWVGGFGPVYKIGPDLRLLKTYIQDEEDSTSVPDEGVTGFAEDSLGYMWMATDNGLARLDERTGRFRTFTTRDGLPDNDIAAVLAVGDMLWVTTSNGIARVNTRRLQITAFDEADGVVPSEFESDAITCDATGRIYFGAVRGLISVQPGTMRLNRVVPPIFLTSFRVNDIELLTGPTTDPTPVLLSYIQNGFTFDMAALSFDNPAGNQFAYRLEGMETRWNQVGSQAFASYTNVPPGDYVLHVIGANNDGVWNREGYRLSVIIAPPFWQRWWFRIALLTALIGLTVFIARSRERRLMQEEREKSELRERIAASEMKALRSQMNPHFLYNSLNAIRLFVLQNDSDNADRYLVKFSRLMRLILENSRQEWVTLASELDQLQLYLELEQLRFDHKFDFTINTDPAIAKDSVSIPPMIIQPYIENSILHGIAHKKKEGKIIITIKPVRNGLECCIDDDGVGRQKAGELKSKTVSSHKSMGLQVTQERLQLISQRDGKETRIMVIDKMDDGRSANGYNRSDPATPDVEMKWVVWVIW